MTCAGMPGYLIVFVVMYSFDYVDLPVLQEDMRSKLGGYEE
jgi:hypothetical protein